MKHSFDNHRRRFMKQAGVGALALSGMPGMLRAMTKMAPNRSSPLFHPDVEMELVARQVSFGVLPGTLTNLFKYYGKLMKGPENSVVDLPQSFLGPLLRFRKGQKVRIHFRSEIDQPTITHWHGLHVPALMDGHPMYQIDNGETFVYEFEVDNRASVYAYHSHAHELTAEQVYQGLAGAIVVSDDEEEKLAQLGLPFGDAYDIPLVIQDRAFDSANQLVYVQRPIELMTGFHGDRILINGRPDFELPVASRAYRLRLANLSNARIYKLGWGDGTPITVIGCDGGLLERPVTKPYVMMGPGERVDVWADFTGREVGAEIVLKNLPFFGVLPPMFERVMGRMGGQGGGGMDHEGGPGMGMMGGRSKGGMMGSIPLMRLPVGSEYPVVKIKVTTKVGDSPKLPDQLSSFRRYQISETANPDKPLPIGISEGRMSMVLNGRTYKMDDIQDFEKIKVDTLQYFNIFHAHEMGEQRGRMQHGAEALEEGSSGEHGASAGGEMNMEGGGQGMGGMNHGMMGGQGMGGMNHGMMGGRGMGGMNHGMMGGQEGHQMDGAGQGGMSGGGMGGMGGAMMFSMAHPIHIHGQQFQITSRELEMGSHDHYETVKHGFITEGLKDVVLVMSGERVGIIKPFDTYKGVFVYHCHNLEHEDMGMMRDFLVE